MDRCRLRTTLATVEAIAMRPSDERICLVTPEFTPEIGCILERIARHFDEPIAVVDNRLDALLSAQDNDAFTDDPHRTRFRLHSGSKEDVSLMFLDEIGAGNWLFFIVLTTPTCDDDWKESQANADTSDYEFWKCVQIISYCDDCDDDVDIPNRFINEDNNMVFTDEEVDGILAFFRENNSCR